MAKVHIDFDRSVNIKKRIKENVEKRAIEWQEKPECKVKYGKPVVGYVSVDHPLFMTYFDNDVCIHPKEIYRPGNTVVLLYIPYSKETVESNKGGDKPSELWTESFYDSMHLAMALNRTIRETFDEVGRIHSGTNAPTDWNEETHREEWSHKLAGFAAGMGRYGIGGSFHTEMGFSGRMSSILVDEHYAPFTEKDLEHMHLEDAMDNIWGDCKYIDYSKRTLDEEGNIINNIIKNKAEDMQIGDKAIAACPGHAISKEGVDQRKCQEYCKTINSYIPSPEVCGKCFYWDAE